MFNLIFLRAALKGTEDGLEPYLRAVAEETELWPVEEPKFEELERFREEFMGRPGSERDRYALSGLALAVEANRLRINEDFRGAEERFRLAAKFAASGSMAPWLVARILDLRASLWIDISALNRARRDLRNAKALGGGFTVLWNLGSLQQLQGEHELAINYFLEAQSQCPPNLLPKLKMNLAYCHAFLGQAVQARNFMAGISFSDSGKDTATSTWIRGLIAKKINWPEALPLLEAAHAKFESIGDQQGAALTAIDIGVAYAELGDFSRLRESATHAYSTLLELGAEPQAINASTLIFQAEMALDSAL